MLPPAALLALYVMLSLELYLLRQKLPHSAKLRDKRDKDGDLRGTALELYMGMRSLRTNGGNTGLLVHGFGSFLLGNL